MLHPLRLDFEKITQVPTPLMSVVLRHCHIDEDNFTPDAQLINLYMLAAIGWFEQETKRSVIARSHRWVLRSFPCDALQEIRLPRGKIQSVQGIQYVQNGSTFTLTGPSASPAGVDFQEDIYGDDSGILMPNQADAWPTTDLDTPTPVIITFIAGWTTAAIPEDALQAMLFYVDDCMELRGSTDANFAGEYLDYRSMMCNKYALRRVF